jgi:hypothetical protein
VTKVDTLFKYRFDTVEFWKDSIFVKFFYEPIDSLVYLEIDCPDNQVITKTETITETITLKPTIWEHVRNGLIAGLIIIVVIAIFKNL